MTHNGKKAHDPAGFADEIDVLDTDEEGAAPTMEWDLTKEDDEVYGAFGDHVIRTKLEPVPSQAKQLLGKDVTDWVFNNYKWFFDQFRYTK